jgi:hypothetical protein
LRGGFSIWTYLLDYLEVIGPLRLRMKPVVKDVTYAALYGMEERDLDATLWDLRNDAFRDLHLWQRPYFHKKIVDCDIIQLILRAREQEMNRALWDGYTITPFGKLPLEKDIVLDETTGNTDLYRTVKTHLTHAASAYALRLMVPTFEVASRIYHDVTITLLQHDGISIDVRPSRRAHIIRMMQAAVQDVADELDIPTCLEVEESKGVIAAAYPCSPLYRLVSRACPKVTIKQLVERVYQIFYKLIPYKILAGPRGKPLQSKTGVTPMAVTIKKSHKTDPSFDIGFRFLAMLDSDDGQTWNWATGEVIMRSFVPGDGWHYCVSYKGQGIEERNEWMSEQDVEQGVETILDEDEVCACV